MNKTFQHKNGQIFENHLEFIDNVGKKLILAKSTRRINTPTKNILNELVDIKYYSSNHWFVLYGSADDTINDMGIIRLVYPKSLKPLTTKSAAYNFNKMVNNLDITYFTKKEKVTID